MSGIRVTNHPEAERYEAHIDGALAGIAEYALDGPNVIFTHTEVGDAYEGRGVGSALAKFALDEVRAAGKRAVPRCKFIRGWIDRHPDYASLVA